MIENKKCTPGQYCDEGLESLGESRNCRAGYYCPEATPVELPCPVGTWNNQEAKAAISDCVPCTAG